MLEVGTIIGHGWGQCVHGEQPLDTLAVCMLHYQQEQCRQLSELCVVGIAGDMLHYLPGYCSLSCVCYGEHCLYVVLSDLCRLLSVC